MAGTDTCFDADAVQPSPLRVDWLNRLAFFLVLVEGCKVGVVVSLLVEEKVERKREEMLDLERVDWITDGISGTGFGSVSVVLIWFLGGLLSFRYSAIVVDEEEAEVSVRNGMAFFGFGLVVLQERKKEMLMKNN